MNSIVNFIKSSKFFGSSWIDRKNKKIYILPTNEIHNIDEFELVILENDNLEYLNELLILDNFKYRNKIEKIFKVSLKRTIKLIENKIKWEVYRNSGFSCFYCGDDKCELTYDHYIPISKGGKTDIENGRASCEICNQTKADTDPDIWMKSEELQNIIKKRVKK